MNKFKIGDHVYINKPGFIGKIGIGCRIINYTFDGIYGGYVYEVEPLFFGDKFEVTEKNIYLTHNDALNAYNKSYNELVDCYKNEIKTVRDLVKFPLNHDINGDYAAQDAYITRYKDLLKVDYIDRSF